MRIERASFALGYFALFLIAGCSGEPSSRELKNRQEFEALLTAISLKDSKQLAADARRIDDRHGLGELSDEGYNDLTALIRQARGGDWAGAEARAYKVPRAQALFQVIVDPTVFGLRIPGPGATILVRSVPGRPGFPESSGHQGPRPGVRTR